MLPWTTRARASISVRRALPKDKEAVGKLLASSRHSHLHQGWRPVTDWIGRAVAFVAENRYGMVGCLITPADPPPAAWIRAAVADDGGPPTGIISRLLEACLADLSPQGVTTLCGMPTKLWLPPILDDLGFAIVEGVESWEKRNLEILRRGAQDLELREASLGDMAELAALERAAFTPRWRHSPETLALARERTNLFTVAERAGQIVGFQISLAVDDRAHLARLTVHPDAQRSGVGRRLLADALQQFAALNLSKVSLNSQTDNTTSHLLYSAFGFQPVSSPLPVWERLV